jgi:hypothetical protein
MTRMRNLAENQGFVDKSFLKEFSRHQQIRTCRCNNPKSKIFGIE